MQCQTARYFCVFEMYIRSLMSPDKPKALRRDCIYNIERTSDSLNEGLPIKMTREKYQRKRFFSMKKDSKFNPRLIHKNSILFGQVPIENMG